MFKSEETIVKPRRPGFWNTVTMLMVGALLGVFLWRTNGLESSPAPHFDRDARIAELEATIALRDREIALLKDDIEFERNENLRQRFDYYDLLEYQYLLISTGVVSNLVPQCIYGVSRPFAEPHGWCRYESWEYAARNQNPFRFEEDWLMEMMSEEFRYTFGGYQTLEERTQMIRESREEFERNGPPPLPFPLPSD
jgi:hypothetical protein